MQNVASVGKMMMQGWNSAVVLLIGSGVVCLVELAIILAMAVRLRRSRDEMGILRRILADSAVEPEPAVVFSPLSGARPEAFGTFSKEGNGGSLGESGTGSLLTDGHGESPSLAGGEINPQEVKEVFRLFLEEAEKITGLTPRFLPAEKRSIH